MKVKTENGINYPVLPQGADGLIKCPFCNKYHRHSKESGHRRPHCSQEAKIKESITTVSGETCYQSDGYYVEYNKLLTPR